MTARKPNTLRKVLVLIAAIFVLYGILMVVSKWLTNAGQGDLAMILFIGGGIAVLGLAAYLFRDALQPNKPDKPLSQRDPFMAALAGNKDEESPKPPNASSSGDDG